jgi:hypothetical protein
LSDDFSSDTLGIQWQYDPAVKAAESFRLGGGKLVMQAAGAIPGKAAVPPEGASWLGVMPVNHSYEAEVEVSISGTAEGGLMLSGRGRDGSWATVGLREGEALATWAGQANYLKWSDKRIFLRLRNLHYDLQCFYSADGKQWTPFENSTYIGGGRILALYAAGEGAVTFRNFKYRGLE